MKKWHAHLGGNQIECDYDPDVAINDDKEEAIRQMLHLVEQNIRKNISLVEEGEIPDWWPRSRPPRRRTK